MRYWEDIEIGETTESAPVTVSEADMIEFARKYDPQYFHTDPKEAETSLFKGLIGSGIYSAALWRIMDHSVNGDIDFVCGVAWDNVKWNRPLRPGDSIVATSVLTSKRRSGKRPEAGIAIFHHEVVKQNGDIILAFDSVDLVRYRPDTRGGGSA